MLFVYDIIYITNNKTNETQGGNNMSLIYEPRGKAREYSPLALNLYLGCTHKCKYCYAPNCTRTDREKYYSIPSPRKNIVKNLECELNKNSYKKQVMLSFIGDCYCETTDNNETTREVLKLLLKHRVPVSILTKNPERALKDLDVIKKFGKHIQVGSTLTFYKIKDSMEWEPGAPTPKNRVDALKVFHDEGVRTFASMEPVIIPEQTIQLIKYTAKHNIIDVYKVGKINNYKEMDKYIDWNDFLEKAVELLRGYGKEFYVKEDLVKCAKNVKLSIEEKTADIHNVC